MAGTGLGRGSWLQGLSILGVCLWQHQAATSVSPGKRHRRALGGLEISSAQLLESGGNFRKVVPCVRWWDEVVGTG